MDVSMIYGIQFAEQKIRDGIGIYMVLFYQEHFALQICIQRQWCLCEGWSIELCYFNGDFFCVQGNHFLYECIFWAELATWLEKFGDLLKFPDNVLEYKFVFAVNGVSVKDDRLNYVILMDNVYRNKLW